MKSCIILFVCLQILKKVSTICDSSSSDVCLLNNNKELPYVYTRHPSIEYGPPWDATKYCDVHALDGGTWYRSSYNLITYCVDHRHCGTSDPIWLDGNLPGISDGAVIESACVRTYNDCCEHSLSVKIRNCTYYMAYCFIDLHVDCHSRYCLDTDLDIETTTTTPTTTTPAPTTTTDAPTTTAASGNTDSIVTVIAPANNNGYITGIVVLAIALAASTVAIVIMAYQIYIQRRASQRVGTSTLSLCSYPEQKPHTPVSINGITTTGLGSGP